MIQSKFSLQDADPGSCFRRRDKDHELIALRQDLFEFGRWNGLLGHDLIFVGPLVHDTGAGAPQ